MTMRMRMMTTGRITARRSRRNPPITRVLHGLAVLSLVASAACASSPPAAPAAAPSAVAASKPAAAPATGTPIRVGAVLALSGAIAVPEVRDITQAVFDEVNAAGGVNGRPIQFLPEDDGSTPDKAAQVAQKLVTQDQVMAMVGSGSIFDCSVNNKLYADNGVYALQAIGVDATCFSSPNIAPLNNGPTIGFKTSLAFAFDTLQKAKVCVLDFVGPSVNQDAQAVADYEKASGHRVTLITSTLGMTEDPTPFVIQHQQAGCEAVVIPAVPPNALPVLKAAAAQNFAPAWIDLGGTYRDDFLAAAGAPAEGHWYGHAEWLPYTESSPDNADFRRLIEQHKIQISSQAAGGYLAAQIFVQAVKGIQGEITRQSVGQALTSVKDFRSGLLGTPWSWGPNANRSSKFVLAKGGQWQTVSGWITAPS